MDRTKAFTRLRSAYVFNLDEARAMMQADRHGRKYATLQAYPASEKRGTKKREAKRMVAPGFFESKNPGSQPRLGSMIMCNGRRYCRIYFVSNNNCPYSHHGLCQSASRYKLAAEEPLRYKRRCLIREPCGNHPSDQASPLPLMACKRRIDIIEACYCTASGYDNTPTAHSAPLARWSLLKLS